MGNNLKRQVKMKWNKRRCFWIKRIIFVYLGDLSSTSLKVLDRSLLGLTWILFDYEKKTMGDYRSFIQSGSNWDR
mgnify:CR=1 FL=1